MDVPLSEVKNWYQKNEMLVELQKFGR